MTREDLIIEMDDFISSNWRAFLNHLEGRGIELTEDEYMRIMEFEE